MEKSDLVRLNILQLGLFGKMERKYTEDGLPVISKGVAETSIRDYLRRRAEGPKSVDAYYSELVTVILENENPELGPFLQMIEKHLSPTSFNSFCFGLGSMYDLFKRQAKTNQLEESQ